MDNDSYDTFERLAKRWPALFSKSTIDICYVPPGWFNVLDTLCRLLSKNLEDSEALIKYQHDNPTNKFKKSPEQYEAEYNKYLSLLPVLRDIGRTNAGYLYIEADVNSISDSSYIFFAEEHTRTICEVCGSKALSVHYDDGTRGILCETHTKKWAEEHNLFI